LDLQTTTWTELWNHDGSLSILIYSLIHFPTSSVSYKALNVIIRRSSSTHCSPGVLFHGLDIFLHFLNNFMIALDISSLTISPLFPAWSSPLNLNPIFHSSAISLQLVNWSTRKGNPNMGTPRAMLSSIEFHPKWVMNPATEGWDNTCSWLHHGTTSPCLPISSRKPSGKQSVTVEETMSAVLETNRISNGNQDAHQK